MPCNSSICKGKCSIYERLQKNSKNNHIQCIGMWTIFMADQFLNSQTCIQFWIEKYFLKNCNDTSGMGYILEVDADYSKTITSFTQWSTIFIWKK